VFHFRPRASALQNGPYFQAILITCPRGADERCAVLKQGDSITNLSIVTKTL